MSTPLPFNSVPEWFEHQVRATPDSVAIVFDEKPITYAELNARANRLARVLQLLGAGPDKIVAFCVARTPDVIVTMLAVMKSGGAYLPIDRDLPPDRQAFMLQDAQPAVLVTERAFRDALPPTDAPVFVLDEEQKRLAAESDADLPPQITGDNLVYILYTSGSTGQPKGVEIPHRALVNLLASVQEWPGLKPDDVFIALTTVSFDIAGVEIFLPLVTGAKVVLLNRDDSGDGFRILHHLEKQNATVLQATPSTWRMLIDAKWAGRPGLKMICTGEALARDLGDALIPRGGELWNMYGPTETTIWSSGVKMQPSPAKVTIGKAIANTTLHVLDPKLRAVPVGVPGELYIGGIGLARAYRNRPELTAERFIADPFSSEPGARLYKTGDVARTRVDGEVEVLGRVDHQVKIRGFRIELGEIEARLNEFEGVKESVVTAHEIAPGRKALVAYLVPKEPGAVPAIDRLREFLKKTLPEYMVPGFFETLAAFPITPNGKIDRKALPAPKIEQARASRPYAAPQGPVETKLAEIWTEILGREKVGRDDNIFEIGGDSLLIFRIAARANEAGLQLAVRQFFQHRSIAELASQVGANGSAGPARPSLVAVSREAYRRPVTGGRREVNGLEMPPMPVAAAGPDETFVLPASVGQKRFWMLEQMLPGDTALNIPIAFELLGPLDVGILGRALQAMVDRHESLRTRLELIDGEPHQIIASRARLPLEMVEAPPASLGRDERMRRVMDAEAKRPVDFTRAPLLRAVLVELAPEDHVLMVTQHHAISDGWSNGLVIRELAAFYDAIRHDTPVALPPLAIQYADFVLWQQEWLKTPEFQQQLAYWRGQLAGDVPPLDVPTDFPRRSLQSSGAILETRLLPAPVTDALRQLCQEEGVTLFMIFLTAYAALLHRYTGQPRILVGTTAANRNRPELEPIIGLFANLLVLPADIGEGMTFRDLLHAQRDRSLGGFAHHEAPFELIMQELQQSAPSRVPMHTHLLFQRAFMQPATAGDLAFNPLRSVSPGSTLEFTFGIVERVNEGIRLQMEYRPSLYRAATVQRMLLHFQQLLEAAADHPETPIAELPLFAENEREEIEARLASALAGGGEASRDETFAELDRQLDVHWLSGKETFAPIVPPEHVALAVVDARGNGAPVGLVGSVEMALPGRTAPEPTPFLGRNMETGVELWGCAEDLIRVSGYRVNRRMVEVHLRAHPQVSDAAVAVTNRLVAQVVLRDNATVTSAELRDWLRGRIGDLFLPASIAIVSKLGLGENSPAHEAEGSATSSAPIGLEAVVQQQLLEIWQRLLKTQDLTPDSNFFDCGGNSFLALRMMTEAEKLVRQPLPLSLLLRGATVRDLGRHILEGANAPSADVIPVQATGSQPPLFYLHGDWIGGGFYCNRLARDLGDDQPFYALPPFHMGEEKIVTMAEMAAWHVAAIRKERPHGPYLLGGYCIGAPVAIEVARQLVNEGETVEHLFLVDPPLWGSLFLAGLWPWIDRIGARKGWSLERRIAFFDRTAAPASRWWRKPARAKIAAVLHRLGFKSAPEAKASAGEAEDDGLGGEEILDGLDFSTYYMTYRLHQLAPLAVPATLFFPESTPEARVAEAPGLTRLDPAGLAVSLIPGNHTTCITEHTAGLAEKMREARDR